MSNQHTSRATPHAVPYRSPPRPTRQPYRPPPPPPLSPVPPQPYRKTPIIIGGLFVFISSAYASHIYTSISKAPSSDASLPAQDSDVSDRYDTTAKKFDDHVAFTEQFSSINYQRKLVAREAKGHVLEVSAGTGRNSDYYRLKKCKSLTFVDSSGPMLEIAKEKFKKSRPDYANAAFIIQSALEPLPEDVTKEVREEGGYDTILQTMGLCSTPQPTQLLMYLGTLAHPDRGRILLLEHGRSYYGWVNDILDKTASKHADKHGCWWNRDIGRIVDDSGLVVERMERKQGGTLWIVEARPKREEDEDNEKKRIKGVVNEDVRSWLVRRVKGFLGRDEEREQNEGKETSEKDG